MIFYQIVWRRVSKDCGMLHGASPLPRPLIVDVCSVNRTQHIQSVPRGNLPYVGITVLGLNYIQTTKHTYINLLVKFTEERKF